MSVVCSRTRVQHTLTPRWDSPNGPVSSCPPPGNTALHDCAESGSLEIMRLLLAYGASMERDGYGMTPLLSASVTGHTNIVDFLTTHQKVCALCLVLFWVSGACRVLFHAHSCAWAVATRTRLVLVLKINDELFGVVGLLLEVYRRLAGRVA